MAGDPALLARITAALPELGALRDSYFVYANEEAVYRFYHQSFKVYSLQSGTEKMVAALVKLVPEGAHLNPWFRQIVAEGTGNVSDDGTIDDWPNQACLMVEANHHARYFLTMVCKFGRELEAAPECPSYGWGAVLELYGLGQRWP